MVIPTEFAVPEEDPAKYRDLFLAVPLGQILIDRSGRVLVANPSADRLFGRTDARLVGRALLDLVEPASGPTMAEAFANAQGGAPVVVKVNGRDAAGQFFPVEIAVVRVRPGPTALFGIVIRDLRFFAGTATASGAVPQYTVAELLMANRLRELV